ncbi:MAG TPA: 30S ribosomal protein S2, partial [Candidatus Dojkabacteria bacterium]
MEDKKENTMTDKKESPAKMPGQVKLDFQIPGIKDFLKTGAQFGHQTKRWNPKMSKYIFTKRGDVHIIDLSQSLPLLENALKFLVSASSTGRILFVGAKKQAAEVVKAEAARSGAYYVIHRWPGGLLTNFNMIKKSLKKLNQLEEDFEKGVEGRTKYEISVMKKEWERLNRLYVGVKSMDRKPKAIVVVDPNYEKIAVREARKIGVPVVALIDTNSDPEGINYPIPANDDALGSLKIFLKLFADAIYQGNEGKGVVHNEKDYTKMEVKVIKEIHSEEDKDEEIKNNNIEAEPEPKVRIVEKQVSKTKEEKENEKVGILGRSREDAKKAKVKTETKKDSKKISESFADVNLSSRIVKTLEKEK